MSMALMLLLRECHELCVSGPAHAGFRYGHALKRSSNMTGRDHIQPVRDIFTDCMQGAATTADETFRLDQFLDARQVNAGRSPSLDRKQLCHGSVGVDNKVASIFQYLRNWRTKSRLSRAI